VAIWPTRQRLSETAESTLASEAMGFLLTSNKERSLLLINQTTTTTTTTLCVSNVVTMQAASKNTNKHSDETRSVKQFVHLGLL